MDRMPHSLVLLNLFSWAYGLMARRLKASSIAVTCGMKFNSSPLKSYEKNPIGKHSSSQPPWLSGGVMWRMWPSDKHYPKHSKKKMCWSKETSKKSSTDRSLPFAPANANSLSMVVEMVPLYQWPHYKWPCKWVTGVITLYQWLFLVLVIGGIGII